MSETITIIFLFTGLVAISAVIFAIWLFVSIVKWMIFGTVNLVRSPAGRAEPASAPTFGCPRRSCRATNPSSARFCRRCGQEFIGAQMGRRAASW